MERFYINEFHRQWIENSLESLASWKKQPISLEAVKEQQERLSRQKEARKKKNQFHTTQTIRNSLKTKGITHTCAIWTEILP